jgi:hypothetical protein
MPNENNRRYYENPLGTIAGFWEEPGPRFVDPYAAEERKAIQEVEREADAEIKQKKVTVNGNGNDRTQY